MTIINHFKDEYAFLSNFYICPIIIDNIIYRSTENFYQAAKSKKLNKDLCMCLPHESKKLDRKLKLRKDWDSIKDNIMYTCILAKFTQHLDLKHQLLNIGSLQLIEGNYWHDNYWGNCYCNRCQKITGKNRLGKILMYIRSQLKDLSEK